MTSRQLLLPIFFRSTLKNNFSCFNQKEMEGVWKACIPCIPQLLNHHSEVISKRKRSRWSLLLWVQWFYQKATQQQYTYHVSRSQELEYVGVHLKRSCVHYQQRPYPSLPLSFIHRISFLFLLLTRPPWVFSCPKSKASWLSACCGVFKHYGIISTQF